jgi:hypothetical protein
VWSHLQRKNNPIRHMRFPAMAARLRIGQSSAGSSLAAAKARSRRTIDGATTAAHPASERIGAPMRSLLHLRAALAL